MAYFMYPYSLQSYLTYLLYEMPCQSLNVYVWEWIDSLDVCEVVLFRSWLVIRVLAGSRQPNSIVDRGLGVCILAHPTEYLWRYSCGYEVEVLEAPVKGAVADHRGGDAFDEDARFGS
jgi:hypothetical protein